MKEILFLSAFLSAFLCSCSSSDTILNGDSIYQSYAPDGIPFTVSDTLWRADMRGNHRALVNVSDVDKLDAVLLELPWRRPDLRTETKKIVIIDAATQLEVKNVSIRHLSSENGRVVFSPPTVPGEYHVYYLPYKYRKGWNDARYGEPWNDYLAPNYNADSLWLKSLPVDEFSLPRAKVSVFESRSKFDFFSSMGTIALDSEVDSLLKVHTENPIIFTEDRAYPHKLTNDLSVRWLKNGPSTSFKGVAMLNEYYVWQIGAWAAHAEIKDIKLLFSDFVNGSNKISSSEVTCFNQDGINWDGKAIQFDINIPKGKTQALWCGIQIPKDATPGVYKGTATLSSAHTAAVKIDIELTVNDEVLADKGDGDLWRHARLRWLNSTIGTSFEPVKPYKTMKVDGKQITATEKSFIVADNGMPQSISINNEEILLAPVSFVVQTYNGTITFDAINVKLTQAAGGIVSWTSSSKQNGVEFNCSAYMEYDGYVRYNLKLSSEKNIPIKDIRLVTNYTPYASTYFMGVGYKGGFRPLSHLWRWEGPWDSYWMGNTEAGLHVEFRGGTYHGPLINDYKPDPSPVWSNDGKGSVSLKGTRGGSARLLAQTGASILTPEAKDFEFSLLITPVKPINSAKHFSERYYHANPAGFNDAAKEGANVANIHHAQSLNPVINYPFIVQDSLIKFINEQHQHDRKVKLYYTIRELTNYAYEIHALKSLNHEIFTSGVGYGIPWFNEHLIDDYKSAWYTELPNEKSDAALVLTGFSRWINYYLEGLKWMLENYKIDGIYMDDVAFDRNVMKRMRNILDEYSDGALIDLHSNTNYSIGPANQYTDFFPYVDRLWFGEHFWYDKMTPDEMLVTFSGIPFGQMSEMLQGGGNRFLGMVYGTTARHSYGKYSPAPVWDLWKSFGIEEAEMIGYWDKECPIKTDRSDVLATIYKRSNKILISIGNFDNKDHSVRLSIDWKSLGMDPKKMELIAPDIEDFQKESIFPLDDKIPVKAKEGWLLILQEK